MTTTIRVRPSRAPNPKVTAAAGGAVGGAVFSEFLIWLLGDLLFAGDVPPQVAALVTLLGAGLFAFAAGWLKSADPADWGVALAYSEWLDGQGLVVGDDLHADKRPHADLAADFVAERRQR